jgi:hypothetical protein
LIEGGRGRHPRRQFLQRLHGEHRVGLAAAARTPAFLPPRFFRNLLHRFHKIDVGGLQLEDALEPRVRRDRFDAQEHAIEDRAGGFRSLVLETQRPALIGVRIDHANKRVWILGDVPAALVEELKRQGDVGRIDVVDVTQERRVRRAVARAREEHRGQDALEARRQLLEAEAHDNTEPASGPGV